MNNAITSVLTRKQMLELEGMRLPARQMDILDRWAIQWPAKVRQALSRGIPHLADMAKAQAEKEESLLLTPSARSMRQSGMSEMEILERLDPSSPISA